MDRRVLRGFERGSLGDGAGIAARELATPHVVLDRQQLGRGVEALDPVGASALDSPDAVAPLPVLVAHRGEDADHVGQVVLALGVVIVDHGHAAVEGRGAKQVEAGVGPGAKPFEVGRRIPSPVDLKVVLAPGEDLLELPGDAGPAPFGQGQQLGHGHLLLAGAWDVPVDEPSHLLAGDLGLSRQGRAQLVGDPLPGPVDRFDDVQGLARLVDEDQAGRGCGCRGHRQGEQGQVGLLAHEAVGQELDRFRLEVLIAHGHEHVAREAETLEGFGGDLGGVSRAELRLLVDVERLGVVAVDHLDHVVGLRAHHQHEAAEAEALQAADDPVHRRGAVDLEADLTQVAGSHARALARRQDHDEGLLGQGGVGSHPRSPGTRSSAGTGKAARTARRMVAKMAGRGQRKPGRGPASAPGRQHGIMGPPCPVPHDARTLARPRRRKATRIAPRAGPAAASSPWRCSR